MFFKNGPDFVETIMVARTNREQVIDIWNGHRVHFNTITCNDFCCYAGRPNARCPTGFENVHLNTSGRSVSSHRIHGVHVYTTTFQPTKAELETHMLARQLVVFIEVGDGHNPIAVIPGTPVRIDITSVETSDDIVTVKGTVQTPQWLQDETVIARLDLQTGNGTVTTVTP
jgi:hypothetical protein